MSKLKYLAAGILIAVAANNTQAQAPVILASNYTLETGTTAEKAPATTNTVALKPTAAMALISTIDKGHIIEAKEMLDNGFDVAAVDYNGQTALHHAAKMGYIELVKKLIREGADVNARDNQGDTALDIVKETNYKFPREPRVITRLLTAELNNK